MGGTGDVGDHLELGLDLGLNIDGNVDDGLDDNNDLGVDVNVNVDVHIDIGAGVDNRGLAAAAGDGDGRSLAVVAALGLESGRGSHGADGEGGESGSEELHVDGWGCVGVFLKRNAVGNVRKE